MMQGSRPLRVTVAATLAMNHTRIKAQTFALHTPCMKYKGLYL